MAEWTTITRTQDEAAWLSDYIADTIAHAPLPLPPHDGRFGHVETHWHQTSPGQVYVAAHPKQGTPADRLLAEAILRAQLEPHGFTRASHSLPLTKQAQWASPAVMDKARRLMQSGAVHLDRNGQDVVVSHVQGDGTDNNGEPDVHEVEMHMMYPGSNKLTNMFCDCEWGKFLNTPRTRTWKRFQYTPCAHIIATYWASLSAPKEGQPPGGPPPGQPPPSGPGGQMSLFDQPPPVGAGGQMSLFGPNAPGQPVPNAMQGPQMPAGGSSGGPMGAPAPEDVLPQFPMGGEATLPQVNPASTPGGRPGPTPTNPLQYPGGTFSSVRSAGTYQNTEAVRLKRETVGQYVGRPESGMAGEEVTIPAGAVGEVLGTEGAGPYEMVNVLWMGKHFDDFGKLMPFGATFWCLASELIPAPGKPPGPAIRRLY